MLRLPLLIVGFLCLTLPVCSTTSASSSSTRTSVTLSTTTAASTPAATMGYTKLPVCWQDVVGTSERLLQQYTLVLPATSTSTATGCITLCQQAGVQFCGVEYGGECYGANSVAYQTPVLSSQCTMPCNGDATQLCGGPNSIQVYQDSAFPCGSNGFYDATSQSCKLACPAGQFKDQSWYSPRCSTCGTNALTCDGNGQALTCAAGTVLSNGICVSAILQSGSGFTYTGCFGDYSRGPHLLSKFILQAATVTDCLSACAQGSEQYCGVTHAGSCFAYGSFAFAPVMNSGPGCLVPCYGSPYACGDGSGVMLVYQNPAYACPSNQFYDPTSDSCLVACGDGYFYDTSGYSPQCTSCGPNVSTCTNPSTILTCEPSYTAYKGSCLNCPPWAAPTVDMNGKGICSVGTIVASNNYTLNGCYIDLINNQRLLASVILYSPTSGVQCLTECQAAGYLWCGLENGNECWAGQNITGSLTASTDCTTPCPDGTEYCGGRSALELYMKTSATTTSSTTTTSTSSLLSSSLKSASTSVTTSSKLTPSSSSSSSYSSVNPSSSVSSSLGLSTSSLTKSLGYTSTLKSSGSIASTTAGRSSSTNSVVFSSTSLKTSTSSPGSSPVGIKTSTTNKPASIASSSVKSPSATPVASSSTGRSSSSSTTSPRTTTSPTKATSTTSSKPTSFSTSAGASPTPSPLTITVTQTVTVYSQTLTISTCPATTSTSSVRQRR